MTTQFRNLIFEGGGMKGIAHIGAMQALEKRGHLSGIKRVGGTSAGAINALIFALGYSMDEQLRIFERTDFKDFQDNSIIGVFDINRLLHRYGWNKGDFFLKWLEGIIKDKLGKKRATFQDLVNANKPGLYVTGSNLSTGYVEVFSAEHNPDMAIADALRISMAIPLFFTAVKYGKHKHFYVDGGVILNYPVKIFDRVKYIDVEERSKAARSTGEYDRLNENLSLDDSNDERYTYNCQTLGLRLDTKTEIGVFRRGSNRPPIEEGNIDSEEVRKIDNFLEYIKALVSAMRSVQEQVHLNSDDWDRTMHIDILKAQTVDFKMDKKMRANLINQGVIGAEAYFKDFEDGSKDKTSVNKIE